MGKEIQWTAKRKKEHFPIAMDVKRLYNYCEANINKYLFDYEYCPIKRYFQAAYDHENYTNKELQSMLNQCKNFLNWELRSIYNDMITGEVNAIN